MNWDIVIVTAYFTAVLLAALSGKRNSDQSAEHYFLSSRNLPWYSIAISTIATNVQGYQFLGMMGSAYLYGLAQANLEINAAQGLLLAAFVFVPMYLRERIITISQFIKKKMGATTALVYSVANLLLFSTMGLGAALFWGAYAADLVFGEYLYFIHSERFIRIAVIIGGLGLFSAIYTYYGGLSAVVRTDLIQFLILITGGVIILLLAIRELGGWEKLYNQTGDLMHLHLPADHKQLPWIAIGGMFLLNINYWCANQSVMQRSLAARSLAHAQWGLITGGVLKYFMAVIIIIPGIALSGILGPDGLTDPDQAFPYLINNLLPVGLKGLILCALFASLMSTVDSTFNSLSTLFSVDIYKTYLRPNATDANMIQAARNTILVTLCTGVAFGILLLYVKLDNPTLAFTHTLNELRYYVNTGITVLIVAGALWVTVDQRWAIAAFFVTIPLHWLLQTTFDLNYFVRAMWVILISLALLIISSKWSSTRTWNPSLLKSATPKITFAGFALLLSLLLLHGIFH